MFALVDCNNFYVSCERVFNPKLKNKAVVVLSNNDGCIIARSNESKALGIKMGDPIFYHKKLIEQKKLLAYSSNFVLYGDMSNRIMLTLKSFGFDTEIYSIDEAFLKLNVSQTKLLDIGYQIKDKIKKDTGIPVSVGIGTTKILAKIANEHAKKENKVIILDKDKETDEILKKTDVEDIWGIGYSFSKKLRSLNIKSAKDLKYAKDETIKKHLKTSGFRTVLELRGIQCFSIEEIPPPKKSILCSRSFRKSISSFDKLEKAIATFVAIAAKKLRDQKSLTYYLSVFITTSKFKEKKYYANSYIIPLFQPSDYTPELISSAKKALKKIYKKNFLYKKAGILFSSLVEKKYTQIDMFSSSISLDKKTKAMKVVDNINKHFDKNAIFFATQGIEKNWISIQTNKSNKFTTSWKELLKAKI